MWLYDRKTKALTKRARQNDVIRILFDEIAPSFKERRGGYTRIVKLHQRQGDAADLAILEWVELASVAPDGSSGAQTKDAASATAAQSGAENTAQPEQKP